MKPNCNLPTIKRGRLPPSPAKYTERTKHPIAKYSFLLVWENKSFESVVYHRTRHMRPPYSNYHPILVCRG